MDQQGRRTLFIDSDSTVWPAEVEYDKAEMEMYGTRLLTTHWYDIPQLIEIYGENYKDIFWKALDPAKMHERELYDGVAEILCNLYHGMSGGYDLHFISHNPFAKDTKPAMREWLEDVMHVGVEFELTVYHERFNKHATMAKDPNAFALIDDRPKNVLGAIDAGYYGYAKAHPWNEELGDIRFDSWYSLPDMLPDVSDVHVSELVRGSQ